MKKSEMIEFFRKNGADSDRIQVLIVLADMAHQSMYGHPILGTGADCDELTQEERDVLEAVNAVFGELQMEELFTLSLDLEAWRDPSPENGPIKRENSDRVGRAIRAYKKTIETLHTRTDDENEWSTKGLNTLVEEYDDLVAFHPGYYVREYMEEIGVSPDELAASIHAAPETVRALVNGSSDLDEDMAGRLSEFFHTTKKFWLNINQAYLETIQEIETRIAENCVLNV